MALNLVKYPVIQVTRRGFTAQAAFQALDTSIIPEVSCTVLPNKLVVSTLDTKGPLSRVSVVFNCGPRHETSKNLGIVHVIRGMTGFGTTKCTGFAIWKNTQQNGAQLYCTGDREMTGFHIVATRPKINESLKYFSAMIGSPAFKPWEVKDNSYRFHYELGGLSPQVKVIENLHRAAFRHGLGNSLYIAKDKIGTYGYEELSNFYKEGFTSNRASIAGYNMTQNEMLEFAKSLDILSNDLPENNSKFFGGEIRKNVNSYFAHVAIATSGAGLKDIKQALTYSVLQHAWGVRPVIKWGGSPSPIYKAVSSAAPDAGVSCLNASYSDAGLFGFMISSSAIDIGNAVTEAMKVIKTGVVSEADFKRAKALVKMNLLESAESSETLVDDMSVQSLLGGVIVPVPVLAEAVDKITSSDVNKAANKVANGKFALSAYGDLRNVPYLDELF